IAKTKQIQRVYRLTADFKAAVALVKAKLDSALKIARIEEGRFVADFEEALGGIIAARDIHRVASHYASEIVFLLAKFNQNVNDVGGLRAVSGPALLAAPAAAGAGAVTQ